MKRTLIAVMAVLLLTGCSSREVNSSNAELTEGAAGYSDNTSSNAIEEIAAMTELARETEPAVDLAIVTGEAQQEQNEPPKLMVTYSGGGLAAAAVMTTGSYCWSTDDGELCVDSIGPVGCAAEGFITACVDLDTVSANEPKITLGGGKLLMAELFDYDGNIIDLDFTADGVISYPENIYEGVTSVKVQFDQGTADYYFMVKRSVTDPKKPPELRVFAGEFGYVMTPGGSEWSYQNGDETVTAVTDISSPWKMYENGVVTPTLYGYKTLSVMLPEGAEITSAALFTSPAEQTSLEFEKGSIKLPEKAKGVCTVRVAMPQGNCEYLFAINNTDEEVMTSPAFNPQG